MFNLNIYRSVFQKIAFKVKSKIITCVTNRQNEKASGVIHKLLFKIFKLFLAINKQMQIYGIVIVINRIVFIYMRSNITKRCEV